MTTFDPDAQRKKLEAALEAFVQRLAADKNVLAAVQVGSFAPEVLWRKESIHLWIIEDDGVSRRLRSDGNDERIFRTFVEGEVNIHAEIIPRSRFKLMVEGSSRTAFSCNFFARRTLVHCTDASIRSWFEKADEVATKDQQLELLATITGVMYAARHARKLIERGPGMHHLPETLLWAARGLAAIEVIKRGEICEEEALDRAISLDPDLFWVIHAQVLNHAPDRKILFAAAGKIDAVLDRDGESYLAPLLHLLKKQGQVMPLSEIADHFAHTQIHPWHLEEACEWLARRGTIQKISANFRLTKKSRVELEEPAYLLDAP